MKLYICKILNVTTTSHVLWQNYKNSKYAKITSQKTELFIFLVCGYRFWDNHIFCTSMVRDIGFLKDEPED